MYPGSPEHLDKPNLPMFPTVDGQCNQWIRPGIEEKNKITEFRKILFRFRDKVFVYGYFVQIKTLFKWSLAVVWNKSKIVVLKKKKKMEIVVKNWFVVNYDLSWNIKKWKIEIFYDTKCYFGIG